MKRSEQILSPRKSNAGFTLVEILVVLVIITILAGFVGINVLNKPNKARVDMATVQLKTLKTAITLYKAEQNKLPTQTQGLQALVKETTIPPYPVNFPEGGYLDATEVPQDPWGNDYIYLIPGRNKTPFEIISYGADGEPGGDGYDADLSSAD